MRSISVKILSTLAIGVTTAAWLWLLTGPTQSDMDLSVTGKIFSGKTMVTVADRGHDRIESEPVSPPPSADGLDLSSVYSAAFRGSGTMSFWDEASGGRLAAFNGTAGSADRAATPPYFAGNLSTGSSFSGGGGGGGGGGSSGSSGSSAGGGGSKTGDDGIDAFYAAHPAAPTESRPTDIITPAVPELSTWAMMILGFAAMGAMTYRSRRIAARTI